MAPEKKRKILSLAGTLIGLGMVVVAIWMFEKTLSRYDPSEAMRRLKDIPIGRIVVAFVCVAASYFLQTLYDYLALLSLGRGASLPKSSLAGFISNALTNNMGFSLLTASSLRFRFYSPWGYSAVEIAQIIAMTKLAFFTGFMAFAGLAQLVSPVELPGKAGELLSPRLLGLVMLVPVAALFLWNGFSKSGYLHFGKVRLLRPKQGLLFLQMAACIAHLIFSGFTLYFLIPGAALEAGGLAGLIPFLSAFMAIKFVVLFFPIPGGLGVLEGTSMALLTPAIHDYTLLGALVGYRLLYYLVPFAIALALLAGYELVFRSGLAARIFRRSRKRGIDQGLSAVGAFQRPDGP